MQSFYDFPYHNTRDIRELRAILQTLRNNLTQEFSASEIDFERIDRILNDYYPRQDKIIEDITSNLPEKSKKFIPPLNAVINELKDARLKTTSYVRSNKDAASNVSYYSSQIVPPLDRLNDILQQIGDSSDDAARDIMASFTFRHKAVEISTGLLAVFLLSFLFYHRMRDKAKNEAIAHREQLFNILGANIDDVFLIVNEERKIEFVSTNSKRITGISAWEIIANPSKIYSYLGPEGGEWLRYNLEENQNVDYLEKDGDVAADGKNLILRIYPVVSKGQIKQQIVVIEDQTVFLERQKVLKDALESSRRANAAKSAFLANMSHEIRTPLNVIIGVATIAQAKIDDIEKVKESLSKIGMSSRHLLALINDVLDMSKIEGGKLSLNDEPFNLRHLVQDIINILQPQALDRKQHFDVFLENVDNESLSGDALRLKQILINLLSNAIKFTPEHGNISLRIQQLKEEKGRALTRFIVTDTGKGMSQDFLKKVYEPFEQANPGVAAKFGGSGLGLAITRNLVSLMDGSINAQSEEGKGSVFSVELPLKIDKAEKDNETHSLPERKILIVNENEEICEQAARILEKLGMRADWTHSMDEALYKLALARDNNDPFDICFLDEKIHDEEEGDPVRRLKDKFAESPLVIMISSYNWRALEKEVMKSGIKAFVEKPFFTSSILDALKAVSENKEEAGSEETPAYDFSGKRVLLVEDNDFNREIATEFLEMVNAHVEQAKNGKEGVEMFEKSAPAYYDLILMDIQMPIMNGYEASRAIRSLSHENASSVPIIAMTANAFDDDVANARAAGMDSHIPKPVNVNQLYETMVRFLHV